MDPSLAISLDKFRAFASTNDISIKPLTLLVGENSTGKTSFLSALRFALSLSDREKRGYFNVYPFDLGSFDDIAYDAGGRPAKNFGISVEKTLDIHAESTIFFSDRNEPDIVRARLEVEFSSQFGEVAICSFVFSFEDITVRYDRTSDRPFTFIKGGQRLKRPNGSPAASKSQRELRNADLRQLTFGDYGDSALLAVTISGDSALISTIPP